jgi:hypothetical protein
MFLLIVGIDSSLWGFVWRLDPSFVARHAAATQKWRLYLFTPRAPRLRAIHVHVPRQCKCVFPSDGQTSLPNRMRLSREQGKNYSQEAS